MLLRFSTENFRSIKNRAILSLSPNNRLERLDEHVATIGKVKALKSAFIYGANASGKSNLIKSIAFSRKLILDGISSNLMYNEHYRSKEYFTSIPGVFQFDLISNGNIYSYGFSINYSNKQVLAEWLYLVKPSGNEIMLFERDKNEIVYGTNVNEKNCSRLKTYKEDIKNIKPTLFLTEIANKNLSKKDGTFFSHIKNVFEWFNKLTIVFPTSKYKNLLKDMKDNNFSEIFCKYMRMFDTGIESFKFVPASFDEMLQDAPEETKNDIKKDIIEAGSNKELHLKVDDNFYMVKVSEEGTFLIEKLIISHNNVDDMFELSDESDGTIRLFDLIPLLISYEDNSVILIDELDRSLHPNLVLKFVEQFFKTTLNKNIQLITTTHQAELMNLDILRRDEIWLIERGNEGTKLYSLDDFKLRSDKDINSAYLLGRYGAVPLFSDMKYCSEDNV